MWIARTFTRLSPQNPHAGIRDEPNAQIVAGLIQHIADARAEHRSMDAVLAARQLADAAPNDPRWWRLLAGLYKEQQDVTNAIDIYRQALLNELPSTDALSMRHELVDHLVFVGDAGAARHEFDQLESMVEKYAPQAQRRSEQTRLDVERASLLRLEGYPRQALESLNRAMANLGDEPLALRLRGTILMDLGEVESAVADLEHVAHALPYDEITHYKLSAAYRRRGRIEDAEICMQKYQQIHDAHLEIQRITREASMRPLSDKQRRRLTQLHKELGTQSPQINTFTE